MAEKAYLSGMIVSWDLPRPHPLSTSGLFPGSPGSPQSPTCPQSQLQRRQVLNVQFWPWAAGADGVGSLWAVAGT